MSAVLASFLLLVFCGLGAKVATAQITAADVASCSGYTLPGGAYGEVSVFDPSSGFATLVGVACSGECHYKALAWGGAVGPSKDAFTPHECHELCLSMGPECEVWQWNKRDLRCDFKKTLTSSRPAWVYSSDYSAYSAPRNCTVQWLPPFESLKHETYSKTNSTCYAKGRVYGEKAAGSCKDVQILAAIGWEPIVSMGIAQGWWPESAGNLRVGRKAIPDAKSCQSKCATTTLCTGFTFSYLEDDTLCVLYGDPETEGTEDGGGDCLLEEDYFGTKVNTVAGIPGACVASESEAVDPYFADCVDMPRCTKPHNKGTFVDGLVFRPSEERCFYHFADTKDMLQCLDGSWVLVSGGSNAILTYINWINSISPGLLHTQRESLRTFYVDVVDIIFDLKGNVVHSNRKTWAEMVPGGSFRGEITTELKNGLLNEWNHYSFNVDAETGEATTKGLVRITLVVGQYWQNTEVAWSAMNDVAGPWAQAKKALFAQIMIWYMVCGIWNIFFCTNPSYMGLGQQGTIAKFKSDFEIFLRSARDQCASSLGCFIAPHLYEKESTAIYQEMIAYQETLLASDLGHAKIQYLDVFSLSALKPRESIENHLTPMMHLWIVHIMLNSICAYADHQDGCPKRLFFSNGCLADTLYADDCSDCECPLYRELCRQNTDGCKDWECMNSRDCRFRTLAISNGTQLKEASYIQPELLVSTSHPETPTKRRIWRGEAWQGWALSLSTWFVSVLVILFPIMQRMKRSDYAKEDQSKSRREKNPQYLGALGFARCIASTHIVVGHLYAKGVLKESIYMFSYGFSWVPWFFMLSGFVLTHARLTSPDPSKVDDPVTFVWKRMANIFPLYAFGVVVSALIRVGLEANTPKWWILVLQSWLLQSFIPLATERALQVHCWFLSSMVLYWSTFKVIYTKLVRGLSTLATLQALAIMTAVPWVASMVLPLVMGEDIEWYKTHRTGDVNDPVDIWTVFVKFHPLCYWHVFVFGMVLAKARLLILVDLKAFLTERAPWLWRTLQWSCASMGYLGLILVFNIESAEPPAYKISSRLSILMPLQGLVLLGLSFEEDPLARIFRRVPKVIGDSSYAQYVLQFIAYDVWPLIRIGDPSFFIFLASLAILGLKLVQDKARWLWMKTKASMVLAPAIMTVVLVLISVLHSGHMSSSRLPDQVTFDHNGHSAADFRIKFNLLPGSVSARGHVVINPSLAQDGSGLLVAGRLHKMEVVTKKGVQWGEEKVTERTTLWHSAIVAGRGRALTPADLSGKAWEENLRSSLVFDVGSVTLASNASEEASSWGALCEPKPVYIPENKTLARKVVTGPEDPKLLTWRPQKVGEETLLTFNSLPPTNLVEPGCHQTKRGVQQMFLSHLSGADPRWLGGRTERTHGVRIDCGSTTKDEKNWIGFAQEGRLFYVYSIFPHVILQVRPEDGACVQRWSTSYAPLAEASIAAGGAEIHGSGVATLRRDNVTGTEYFVGLLHFVTKTDRVYSTMVYRFEAQPPFSILGVSRPLPLQRASRAFASGLLLVRDAEGQATHAVVTYGVENQESRAIVLTAEHLDSLF